jgi:nucleotide-binding universal stress UspA family protein
MFTRIVVPLDGSELAERALPLAERMALACGARIRLVFVHQVIPISAMPPDVGGTAAGYDRYARVMEENYLREAAARLGDATGLEVTTVLLDGPVARALAAEVTRFDADLVVMTTHGRGAVSRFWMGSVADELVRTLEVPVLLVREAASDRVMPRRILVPLDGSVRSETALDFAARVAKLGGGTIELLQVVPPVVPVVLDGSPMTPAVMLPPPDDLLTTSAAEYLESRAAWLRADGIGVTISVVTDSSPARAIVDTADRDGIDLVAIATHGAGGIRRMVLGSVTDKVLRASLRPLLVFRPPADPSPRTEAHAAAAGAGVIG